MQRGFLSTALYSLSASDNWLDSPLILFSDEGCDETNSRLGLLLSSCIFFQRLKLAKGLNPASAINLKPVLSASDSCCRLKGKFKP